MDNRQNDDISLEGIRNYMRSMKLFYFGMLGFLMKSFRENLKVVFIFLIAGAGFAFYEYSQDVPYYEGKASFTYYELHKRIYGEMIEKLKKLAQTRSYKSLAQKLKLSEKEAKNIIDLQALNLAGGPLSEDMSEPKHPFYVWAKLRDGKFADTLLVHLENYMNSNPQAITTVINNTRQMQEKIVYYKAQLQKLDSLKNSFRMQLLRQNSTTPNTTINTFNPIDIYTESEKLFNSTSDLESAVKSYKAVKILDQFVMGDYPISKSLFGLLLKYLAIGLGLGIILSLFLSAVKKL